MSIEGYLTYERQQLVLTTVAEAVRATPSRRRAPSVAFEVTSTTALRSKYDGRHNQVRFRVRGFLDDPAVADDTIRAVVLHETGHWADRWRRPGDYGIAAGIWMVAAGGIVYLLGCVLLFTHTSTLGAWALVVGPPIAVLGVLTISAWSWPAEYRADAFAAQRIGAKAVVAMVITGRHPRASITHPSHGRRELHLTRNAAT